LSILAWIFLGLVSGFIASMAINRPGAGIVLGLVLGIAGAVMGGLVFNTLGRTFVPNLNLYGLLVAFAGAILLLVVYRALDHGTR